MTDSDRAEQWAAVEARPSASRIRRLLTSPWLQLVAVIVLIGLVQALWVKVYQVPSASMEQTLQEGDRVLVNRLAYAGGAARGPAIGDVVVFNASDAWDEAPVPRSVLRTIVGWFGDIFGVVPGNAHTLVKRVIAGPGDTISCCDFTGRVQVNGEPLHEHYLYEDLLFEHGQLDCQTPQISQRCFGTYTVPADSYVVLGDHRSDSDDSVARCRGTTRTEVGCLRLVRRADVVGQVFLVLWPPTRWTQPLSEDPR
ncbi:signal peptidase I [Rathayibacter sp. YIM 133350]|uniref:signal peptidase I n=1 Tax=Rathayibacter sp. YIM 133350 TaxID=3131992 RepID=UPI00307DB1BE